MADGYRAPSRLALMLHLELVLNDLCDHLPGEPPALIAWGPGALAEKVADGLLALALDEEQSCPAPPEEQAVAARFEAAPDGLAEDPKWEYDLLTGGAE